jgi:hypothetical protein
VGSQNSNPVLSIKPHWLLQRPQTGRNQKPADQDIAGRWPQAISAFCSPETSSTATQITLVSSDWLTHTQAWGQTPSSNPSGSGMEVWALIQRGDAKLLCDLGQVTSPLWIVSSYQHEDMYTHPPGLQRLSGSVRNTSTQHRGGARENCHLHPGGQTAQRTWFHPALTFCCA